MYASPDTRKPHFSGKQRKTYKTTDPMKTLLFYFETSLKSNPEHLKVLKDQFLWTYFYGSNLQVNSDGPLYFF